LNFIDLPCHFSHLGEILLSWLKNGPSIIGLLLGCFFVYIACFLTESEEHEIVDHLSTWWITIKDRQQAAESGLAAFLAGITGFTSFVLDRLFGQKLLTTRGGGGLALLVGPTNSVVIDCSERDAVASHSIRLFNRIACRGQCCGTRTSHSTGFQDAGDFWVFRPLCHISW
jgi:hypothetical protein